MRANTRNADKVELYGEVKVKDFSYLGSNVSTDGGSDRDIQARIGNARNAFTILTPVWRSKVIHRKAKQRISRQH